MNKTKIDWADSSWNPVSGCLHTCEYCYARKIATRFAKLNWQCDNCNDAPSCATENEVPTCYYPYEKMHDLEFRKYIFNPKRYLAYPYGFEPTFHRYRLEEPSQKTKPQNIFVCSMADLFGDWVPDEWIREVFKACEAAPQHNYIFLTKNPIWLAKNNNWETVPHGSWFGVSIESQDDLWRAKFLGELSSGDNSFISIEPLQSEINLKEIDTRWYSNIDWVIIGAESGNRKGKIIPKREWIEKIVKQCKAANVPVFMKESLRELMGPDFIQEFPEGLMKE